MDICTQSCERVAKCETEINNIKERVCIVEDTTKAIYQINANMERMFGEMRDLKQDSIKATDEIKEDIKGIKSDLSDVKKEVDLVKEIPSNEKAKKWDKFIWFVFTGVGGAVIGYIMNIVLK